MAHDVFVSYAKIDKPTADALVATLEQQQIRCWVAPRDVTPGKDYAASLVRAINSSRVLVLVFSSSANTSPHVMREIERAASKSIPILPLRIEDVSLSESMEFFISSTHWLDALTPPLQQHLERLARSVEALLDADDGTPGIGGERGPLVELVRLLTVLGGSRKPEEGEAAPEVPASKPARPSAPLAASAKEYSERVFLDRKGVSVTQSRFVGGGQTHLLQGVTSFRVSTSSHSYQADRFWPIALMGFSAFAVVFTALEVFNGDARALIGVLVWGAALFGGYVWYESKGKSRFWTTHALMLTTSSGESAVLVDEDEAWVDQVFKAVNEAITARG